MTEKQTDTRLRFSDLMGQISSREGMPKNAGRIIGYLMMSSNPVAFADLCKCLGISRGGASENTRHLEQHGIIERINLHGDRRDHFQIRNDAGTALNEKSRQRSIEHIHAITAFRKGTTLAPFQEHHINAMESFISARLVDLTQALASTDPCPMDPDEIPS